MPEENSKYYDSIFSNSKTQYKNNPEDKCLAKYYFCWKRAADFIEENNIKLVVDIGCGPGHFPEVIKKCCIKNKNLKYIGIDFSEVAISIAINKFINNKNYKFLNADALKVNYEDLVKDYDINNVLFTSFEFMEHINFDIELLGIIPSNYRYIWSVPSYNCKGHVRWFKTQGDVTDRYNKFIKLNLPIIITPFKKFTYYIDSTIR